MLYEVITLSYRPAISVWVIDNLTILSGKYKMRVRSGGSLALVPEDNDITFLDLVIFRLFPYSPGQTREMLKYPTRLEQVAVLAHPQI